MEWVTLDESAQRDLAKSIGVAIAMIECLYISSLLKTW